MNENLKLIEEHIKEYSKFTELKIESISLFPQQIKNIHSLKVFGDNILSIPAELLIKNDVNEFEHTFKFLLTEEELEIFEKEYRTEVPENFIQFGYLNGTTEIVLLNKIKKTVHIFHISDIADKDWLKYKLNNEICNLETFIENIRIQTVCCLIDPKNYSKFDIFEIRNEIEIKNDDKLTKYVDYEKTWTEYKKLIENSLKKGYEIHYAPKKILIELDK